MAKKEPKVEQPTEELQKEYKSLVDNDPTIVHILGTKKKYKLRWLRNGQLEKLGRLIIHKKSVDNEDLKPMDVLEEMILDSRLACQTSAIYLLDGFFKIKFFYWFLWRWFYYIKQYTTIQLSEILEEGKKKIPLAQFFIITMSLTEARDTLMMMTMREAERILREQNSGVNSQTANNSNGSSSQGTT